MGLFPRDYVVTCGTLTRKVSAIDERHAIEMLFEGLAYSPMVETPFTATIDGVKYICRVSERTYLTWHAEKVESKIQET